MMKPLLALAAVLVLGACGVGVKGEPNPPANLVAVGGFSLTLPRGFHSYGIRGGFYRTGTRPPVIGGVVTDYPVPAHSPLRKGVFPESQPPDGVALEVQHWLALGPPPPTRLHLPLSLGERWVRKTLTAGTRRYGWLRDGRLEYEVLVWIGRKAPSRDRAALLQALRSIRAGLPV